MNARTIPFNRQRRLRSLFAAGWGHADVREPGAFLRDCIADGDVGRGPCARTPGGETTGGGASRDADRNIRRPLLTVDCWNSTER